MTAKKSICLECMQKYTGWATSDICPVCHGKLIPISDYVIPDDKPLTQSLNIINDELPITCEFPIENLPYAIKAHKIGDTTMLCFTGKEWLINDFGEVHEDYFVIAIRDKSIHIGTCGG